MFRDLRYRLSKVLPVPMRASYVISDDGWIRGERSYWVHFRDRVFFNVVRPSGT